MSNAQPDRPLIEFPKKVEPLFQPRRYKVLYGGRGGSKSWTVARILLTKAAEKPLRILCVRELQKSIKDSVHKLLSDQIEEMGLSSLYEILQANIAGKNGSEFFFESLRHNTSQIKSYEGVDIVWVEEAQSVSKSSWDILIPTIRKENSEIWITFNPELQEDETYQRFVVDPPKNSTVLKVNYSDNPWFPDVLRDEMDELKRRSYDDYLAVWEGHCRQSVEGAIYAQEIRQATEQDRITNVPYDATRPVNTYWDLGWADNTSVWFVQKIGFEYRVIDYYQSSHQPLTHYIQVMQQRPYIYATDHLPHDARAKQLGTGKSIEEMLRSLGRKVEIVPQLSIADGIAATRAIFPACWFDAKRCADGLQALRRYRYNVSVTTGQTSREPLHDEYSHGADAFRYFAVAPVKSEKKQKSGSAFTGGEHGWLGA